MENFLKEITELCSEYAVTIVLRLISALLIYIIGRQLIKLLRRIMSRSKKSQEMHETARGFISSCINIVLNLILILTIASVLGVPMTSIVALLGSAGLAVGLALQGGLSNFAGGIMILIFKPFETGDYICSGTEEGTVSKISVFYTTLQTVDNRRIVIPNSAISNATVINVTAERTRRVDLTVNVAPETDLDLALSLLLNKVAADERVIDETPPFAALTGYGQGFLILTLRVWCNKDDYWALRFDMLRRITDQFSENGIIIPKPVLDVTVKNAEE